MSKVMTLMATMERIKKHLNNIDDMSFIQQGAISLYHTIT